MRRLATVRKITGFKEIPNRDFIVLALIDGWQAIVHKDEFKEGELVIFCEPDSVLPAKPEFEFLAKRKYRVTTMKMAGVLSQGLVLPISMLRYNNVQLGDDVTDELNIHHYEGNIDNTVEAPRKPRKEAKWLRRCFPCIYGFFAKKRQQREEFPRFLTKTDEERIQNIPYFLGLNTKWTITEKIDGTSTTFFLRKKLFGYEFGVCSRNKRLLKPDDTPYWQMANKLDIKNVLKDLLGKSKWIAIQGECIGPKIQGNPYKLNEVRFYAFNLIYPSGRIDSYNAYNILEHCKVPFVPILETDVSFQDKSAQDLINMADGKSKLADVNREGFVCRSDDGKLSFKAVSPKYLLAKGE